MSGWLREKAFVQATTDEYKNSEWEFKLELLALTPSNNLDVAVHATSVLSQ